MNLDELNEIATLLHVTSEIATNHPKLASIQRACQRRLDEINQELIEAEAKKPVEEPLVDNSNVEVERRV